MSLIFSWILIFTDQFNTFLFCVVFFWICVVQRDQTQTHPRPQQEETNKRLLLACILKWDERGMGLKFRNRIKCEKKCFQTKWFVWQNFNEQTSVTLSDFFISFVQSSPHKIWWVTVEKLFMLVRLNEKIRRSESNRIELRHTKKISRWNNRKKMKSFFKQIKCKMRTNERTNEWALDEQQHQRKVKHWIIILFEMIKWLFDYKVYFPFYSVLFFPSSFSAIIRYDVHCAWYTTPCNFEVHRCQARWDNISLFSLHLVKCKSVSSLIRILSALLYENASKNWRAKATATVQHKAKVQQSWQ